MELLPRNIFWELMVIGCLTFLVTAATETQKEYIKDVEFKKLYTLKGHKDIVQEMKILKNGLLISGSADTTMRIWNLDGVCKKRLYNYGSWINSVEELSDGRIACGANGGTVNLWDVENNVRKSLSNLENERIYANSVIQLSDGCLAFSTWMREVKLWDADKDICLKTVNTGLHDAWISSLIELKDSPYLVTSSWDKTIKIWDISQDTSTCVKTLKGHTDCVNVVKQLNDQTLVSGADDKVIVIWDIVSGDSKATLSGHSDRVYALLIVNEKIISGSRDKTVRIWDPTLQSCIMTIPCKDKVYSLAFSSDEQYLFVGLGCGDIEVFQIFF